MMAAIEDRPAHVLEDIVIKWTCDVRLAVTVENGRLLHRRSACKDARHRNDDGSPIAARPKVHRRRAGRAARPASDSNVRRCGLRQQITRANIAEFGFRENRDASEVRAAIRCGARQRRLYRVAPTRTALRHARKRVAAAAHPREPRRGLGCPVCRNRDRRGLPSASLPLTTRSPRGVILTDGIPEAHRTSPHRSRVRNSSSAAAVTTTIQPAAHVTSAIGGGAVTANGFAVVALAVPAAAVKTAGCSA